MSTEQLTPGATATGSRIGRASGFELASPGQPGAANVEAALERNPAFAAAGGHQSAVVFSNLRLFVIACLDPRGSVRSERSGPASSSPSPLGTRVDPHSDRSRRVGSLR